MPGDEEEEHDVVHFSSGRIDRRVRAGIARAASTRIVTTLARDPI
jgi:hypothetical protein